jgi:hypothetical protein
MTPWRLPSRGCVPQVRREIHVGDRLEAVFDQVASAERRHLLCKVAPHERGRTQAAPHGVEHPVGIGAGQQLQIDLAHREAPGVGAVRAHVGGQDRAGRAGQRFIRHRGGGGRVGHDGRHHVRAAVALQRASDRVDAPEQLQCGVGGQRQRFRPGEGGMQVPRQDTRREDFFEIRIDQGDTETEDAVAHAHTDAAVEESGGEHRLAAPHRRVAHEQAGAPPLVAEHGHVPSLLQLEHALAFGHVLVIRKRMPHEAEQQKAHGDADREAEHHHRGIRRLLDEQAPADAKIAQVHRGPLTRPAARRRRCGRRAGAACATPAPRAPASA